MVKLVEFLLNEKIFTGEFTFGFELEAICAIDNPEYVKKFISKYYPDPELKEDSSIIPTREEQYPFEYASDILTFNIPTILKVNSSNSLAPQSNAPYQAITASVKDALRLGCAAIGFTIYPGSDNAYEMMSEISAMAEEALPH